MPFTSPASGYKSPVEALQGGNLAEVMDTLKKGFLGMSPDGQIDIMGVLNPMNMDAAKYTKLLLAAGIIAKIRKSVFKVSLKKIPMLGKYVS